MFYSYICLENNFVLFHMTMKYMLGGTKFYTGFRSTDTKLTRTWNNLMKINHFYSTLDTG